MSVASVGYVPVTPTIPVLEIRGQQPVKQEPKEKPQAIQSTQTQAQELEQIGQAFNKKLQFVVDHGSNEVLVKVIDKDTDRVIKVIPPEELQRLHRNLKEAIGLLFNEMV